MAIKPPPGFVMVDQQQAPPPGFVIIDGPAQEPGIWQQIKEAFTGGEQETIPSAMTSPEFESARKAGGIPDIDAMSVKNAATMAFGEDEDIANMQAQLVPGAEVTQDERGRPVVQLPDGRRFYANKPGLDLGDIARLPAQAAAFMPAARLGGMAASLLGRVGLTGGLTAATDIGGQALGRDDIDLGRAALVGGLGAGAEFAGPIVGKVLEVGKKLFRSGASKQQAALAAARAAGVQNPTNKQVAALSKALGEIEAGADPATILGADEFGFLYTRGQKMPQGAGKFKQLSTEEMLRQEAGDAGEVMRGRELSNLEAMKSSLERIAGGFGAPRGATPAGQAEKAQGILKSQAEALDESIGAAYKAVSERPTTAVASEFSRNLPDRLRRSVRDFDISDQTPAAARALAMISEAQAGLRPGTKGVTLRALESMRRKINATYGTAKNPTDREMMRRIKGEYDAWSDEAFDKALISGDADTFEMIKQARSLRAEFGRRFEGREAVDKLVARAIADDATPEELINTALGASQISKAAASRFVDRIKAAAGGDTEVANALRAAHFLRLTQGRAGEPLGMQAIAANIKATETDAPSIIRALYPQGEWSQIKRLGAALEPMIPRGDFARTSGTAERIARLAQSMPGLGSALKMAAAPLNTFAAVRATGKLKLPLKPTARPAVIGASMYGALDSEDYSPPGSQ